MPQWNNEASAPKPLEKPLRGELELCWWTKLMEGRIVGVQENKRKGNELKLIHLNIQEFNPPCLTISFQETRDVGLLFSFTDCGSFIT